MCRVGMIGTFTRIKKAGELSTMDQRKVTRVCASMTKRQSVARLVEVEDHLTLGEVRANRRHVIGHDVRGPALPLR